MVSDWLTVCPLVDSCLPGLSMFCDWLTVSFSVDSFLSGFSTVGD